MYLSVICLSLFYSFFFNDTATTEIYTLSLHDALPICQKKGRPGDLRDTMIAGIALAHRATLATRNVAHFEDLSVPRSEEHTSELQSPMYLVCRLLLEKKKKKLK